ncbi:MAG: thiamine pyrophosphate-binding protein [Deltaproteobacteria bacterium]|nr:MAG: thiamine pyrophosphate-binding protein [Deltaproteobacteria bacterium]
MKGSGASALVTILEREGVEVVYGIPGVRNVALYEALRNSAIRPVVVTNERTAGFMADAHARSTGSVGVCAVIPGPGVTNLLSGLGEALLDSSPMVVLMTAVRKDRHRPFQAQEIPQAELVEPLVKRVFRIRQLATLPEVLGSAFRTARTGEPGPVAVDIPENILLDSGSFPDYEPLPPLPTGFDEKKFSEIVALLCKARQVGIYAGFGAVGARGFLETLAELLDAPIATTISGRGIIPEDHPRSVGFGFGPAGNPIAEEIFRQCDTVLAIGCKFGEVATGAYGFRKPRSLIHVDINGEVLGRNRVADRTLRADAAVFLPRLVDVLASREVKGKAQARTRKEIARLKEEAAARLAQLPERQEAVSPIHLLHRLRSLLPRDAIVTTDSGSHQFWVAGTFPVYEARTLLTPTDFQATGFGIPAAVAAKIAFPTRPVVAITGDAGLLAGAMEVLTAIREEAPIKILLFHNRRLTMVRAAEERRGGGSEMTERLMPDLEALSAALSLRHFRIERDAQISDVLASALDRPDSVLIEAHIPETEIGRYLQARLGAASERLPFSLRLRYLAREAWRAVTG